MNPKLEGKLVNEFPDLFAQVKLPMSQTCMYRGIETGDGWYDIIRGVCKRIQKVCEQNACKVELTQVKEKFGTLRIYFDLTGAGDSYDEVDKIINEAEIESSKTCEECGDKGKINRGGWLSVRCDTCRRKREGQ